mgnify:CR=1 FL=1
MLSFARQFLLYFVLTFRLNLIEACGAQVLDTLGVLALAEQSLVHADEQHARPVGIELAAEILIGVEGHIVPEPQMEEVHEGGLARIPLA